MKNCIRLTDLSVEDINRIFAIADELEMGKYQDFLKGKTAVMFFTNNSIRTRVTFEKAIYLLGGQTVVFPPETLAKREELRDVVGYLNNWTDLIVCRYRNIDVVDILAEFSKVPVVNALTDVNHPCEILSDIYALKKMGRDIAKENFLFCGPKGNIGGAWKEASQVLGFELEQCCPKGYEIEGLKVVYDLETAIAGKDIICTDSLPVTNLRDFRKHRITKDLMGKANKGAILNPCPPFYRGEEVSEDVIDSDYFVGYEFKKSLMLVQQAIIIYCLTE